LRYEAELAESRREAREIADLNQAMVEDVETLIGQLKASGASVVPSFTWLATP
jgi:hypothetical protein